MNEWMNEHFPAWIALRCAQMCALQANSSGIFPSSAQLSSTQLNSIHPSPVQLSHRLNWLIDHHQYQCCALKQYIHYSSKKQFDLLSIFIGPISFFCDVLSRKCWIRFNLWWYYMTNIQENMCVFGLWKVPTANAFASVGQLNSVEFWWCYWMCLVPPPPSASFSPSISPYIHSQRRFDTEICWWFRNVNICLNVKFSTKPILCAEEFPFAFS